MEQGSVRGFTLTDAMMLTAATALGIATAREALIPSSPVVRDLRGLPVDASIFLRTVLVLVPCIMAWTVSVVILRLRRPRPPIRSIAQQPGVLACGAVTVAFGVRLLEYSVFSVACPDGWAPTTLELVIHRGHTLVPLAPSSLVLSRSPILHILVRAPDAGLAVMIGWLTLAVVGRWHAEPSWLDHLGRVLGAFWIGMIPLNWALYITTL